MRSALFLLSMAVASPALAASKGPAFIPVGTEADGPAGFDDLCSRDSETCRAMAPHRTAFVLPAALRAWEPERNVWATGAVADAPASQPGANACLLPATDPVCGIEHALAEDAVAPLPDATDWRLARSTMKLLDAVNLKVNRTTIQVSDQKARGVEEFWSRPAPGRRTTGDCEDIAIEKRMRLIEAGLTPEALAFAVVYHPTRGLHTVLVAHTEDGDYVLDSLSSKLSRWSDTRYTWLRLQSHADLFVWNRVAS